MRRQGVIALGANREKKRKVGSMSLPHLQEDGCCDCGVSLCHMQSWTGLDRCVVAASTVLLACLSMLVSMASKCG